MAQYDEAFYLDTTADASAEVIVPILVELTGCKSVLDLGCGDGAWLRCFMNHGVTDVLGLDGPYIDPKFRKVPAENFIACDLSQRTELGRTFDLAMSLEVAEHLAEEHADRIVSTLCDAAPVVYFSAAIPQQGGRNHVNEQWQRYWVDKFESRGMIPIDAVRPRIWECRDVQWWYCQNSLLFASHDTVDSSPALRREADRTLHSYLSLVHPRLFEIHLQDLQPATTSIRRIAPLILPGIRRAITRRFGR